MIRDNGHSYLNALEGNVGIGTTSPEYQLHIKNDSGVGDFKIEGNQPRIWLSETDQTDLNTLIRNNNSLFQIDTVADDDSFIANRLTILNTDGNVGIGTTTPSEKLEVKAPTMSVFRDINDVGLSNGIKFKFGDSASTDIAQSYASIGGVIENNTVGSHNGALAFSTAEDGNLTIAQERMRIASSGNVGIRTTSPQEAFHLKGDHKRMFIGSDDYNLFSLGRRSTTEPDTAYLQMNDEGTKKVILDTNGDSYFLGGNLGVGTDNPGALLTVEGTGSDNVQAGNLLGVVSDTNGKLVDIRLEGKAQTKGAVMSGSVGFDPNNNCVYLANDNDQTLNVTGGNVGIGTTSPDDGLLHLKQSGNDAIRLQRTDAGANNGDIYLGHSGGGFSISTSGAVGVTSADLHIDSAGNVGIGTTSPGAKLEISADNNGDSKSNYIRITDEDTSVVANHSGGGIQFYTKDVTEGIASSIESIYSGNGGGGELAFSTSVDSQTATVEAMRIDSNGNVGIGTTNPFGKLDVRGRVYANSLSLNVASTGDAEINSGSSTYALQFKAGNFDTMHISKGGNVGIGTTSPGYSLDVHTINGGGIGVQGASDANHGWRLKPFGNDLQIVQNLISNGERLTIQDGGNVGIGTTSPASHLHVVGQGYFTRSSNTSAPLYAKQDGTGPSAYFMGGNVGIGTTNPSATLQVVGSLSKSSGSFRIDHPVKPETHDLVHSFVEAPQADNIYRGKVDLVAGKAEVNIDSVAGMTEGTFVLLNREIQVFTSNESDWDAVRGKVEGNKVIIECQNAESTATISWLVIGERQDKHMYDTEWTDDDGKVIVEPLKPEPEYEEEEPAVEEVSEEPAVEAPVEEPQAESDPEIITKEGGKEYIRIGDKDYEVLGKNEDGSLILDDDVTNNG